MILQKLNDLGIDLKGASSGIKKTWCPVCAIRKGGNKKDQDLSVNIDTGAYKCHSNNCNFQGRVSLKEYKRPEWKPNLAGVPRDLANFALSRGLSQETIVKEKVTFEGGNIFFNYFKNELLVNFKKRSIKDKHFSQFPEAEKILYRHDSLIGKTKGIIVEGEIDALTWVELGFDKEYAIVSLDNGAGDKGVLDGKLECLKNAALLVDKITEWYLAGDNDAAGDYTFKEIARRIGEYRCKKIDFGKHKDSNEKLTELIKSGLAKDLIAETFRRLVSDANPLPVLGIQPLDNKMVDEMIDRYHNGVSTGDGIGSSLDSYWTNLDGELTLITGYPGDGKSQFLRFVAVNLAMKKGYRFACYCVEDNPASYFYEDLATIFMGKNLDPKYPDRASEAEYRSALNFIKDKFFYIHPEPDPITGMYPLPDNKWINEKIAFLKLQYGVNSYIKDPWNKIYHNLAMAEHKYLENELSNEKLFGGGYKACLYVAHPVGSVDREKDGSLKAPTQYKISGGAMFNNMMDNIIVVFRPERELDPKSKRVQILIKKIKKKRIRGDEGIVEFTFHKSTNRYDEAMDDMGFDTYNPKIEKRIEMKVTDGFDFTDLGEIPF